MKPLGTKGNAAALPPVRAASDVATSQLTFKALCRDIDSLGTREGRRSRASPSPVPAATNVLTAAATGTATALALTSAAGPSTSALSPHVDVTDIDRLITNELGILATQCETPSAANHHRLAIFKTAFRMVLPRLAPPVSMLLERIMLEHDHFLQEIESVVGAQSLARERKKIEDHYFSHFVQVADQKERDLARRRDEFSATEQSLTQKYRVLDHQLSVVREENARLRQQQVEDHERIISMAQSVVDSRLSAQRAELATKELQAELRRAKDADGARFDVLKANEEMQRILRARGIPFGNSRSLEGSMRRDASVRRDGSLSGN